MVFRIREQQRFADNASSPQFRIWRGDNDFQVEVATLGLSLPAGGEKSREFYGMVRRARNVQKSKCDIALLRAGLLHGSTVLVTNVVIARNNHGEGRNVFG